MDLLALCFRLIILLHAFFFIHLTQKKNDKITLQATVTQTGEVVAIKKVLQDKRFKNRELQIMRQLNHPNVVQLKHCFYSNGEKADELYLNLVLEYIPETVYRCARQYQKAKQMQPIFYTKIYVYQVG